MTYPQPKISTNRQGHSLTEVREESIVVMAEVFKLSYLRYGNNSSLKVLFQYLQDLQPDEFASLLLEAEERSTQEIIDAEAKLADKTQLKGMGAIDLYSALLPNVIKEPKEVH